ncbi:MAG: prolipoprotein diacylglyceryl transferase [Verrucomicrobia bacterium]|nr:MAG: prolipoprotein diacylglyceryl transferase [Verrucomicrobiota bacterium]
MPLLAYYLHHLSPFLIQFGSNIGIRYYGLAYVLGFLCGYWLYRLLVKRGYSEMQPSQVADFMLWWVVLGTLIGGRLGYMLLYDTRAFLDHPLSFFEIWQGGMASHGGMIGLCVATLIYARKHRISWLNTVDNLAVVAPIGLFFGRCANFINGELFGRATSLPWAVQFPRELYFIDPNRAGPILEQASQIRPDFGVLEILIAHVPTSPALQHLLAQSLTPRHPSQIYEALLEGVLLFLLLWFFRTHVRWPNGILSGLFCIFYAFFRFCVEFVREPDAPLVAGMSRGQFFSLFLIPLGVGLILAGFLIRSYPPIFRRDFPVGFKKQSQRT